tara:strand:+ start:74 stop:271 length:198 start_codon:yes stop_codon:yes gene_type:complete
MESKYAQFMRLNRELLNCYGQIDPNTYITMDESTQKDVCYSERLRLEEVLVKGRIQPSDFFEAAK